MNIAEPDVALTDYALTLESVILAWLLHRTKGGEGGLGLWFMVFFCALGLAAFAGGTAHGFILDKASFLHTVIWDSVLISIGLAGLSAWMIGARLIAEVDAMRWLRAAAVALFIIYCAVVVSVANFFLIAIIYYLPAALFLFAAFEVRYIRYRERYFLSGIIGLLLTFAAAAVQQARIGLHAVWFNHNAFYHLIQAVALVFLFLAARAAISARAS